MKFKKQIFGFMDMLRFTKLVPNRREALANGADITLPKEYRTNRLAERLHPGYMQVELTEVRELTPNMHALTFRRTDSDEFPFFPRGAICFPARESRRQPCQPPVLHCFEPQRSARKQADPRH